MKDHRETPIIISSAPWQLNTRVKSAPMHLAFLIWIISSVFPFSIFFYFAKRRALISKISALDHPEQIISKKTSTHWSGRFFRLKSRVKNRRWLGLKFDAAKIELTKFWWPRFLIGNRSQGSVISEGLPSRVAGNCQSLKNPSPNAGIKKQKKTRSWQQARREADGLSKIQQRSARNENEWLLIRKTGEIPSCPDQCHIFSYEREEDIIESDWNLPFSGKSPDRNTVPNSEFDPPHKISRWPHREGLLNFSFYQG